LPKVSGALSAAREIESEAKTVTNGGLGCVSARSIARELKAGTLVKIRTDWLDLGRMLTIVQHGHLKAREVPTAFLTHVLAACAP
jgi:hypothetical protein